MPTYAPPLTDGDLVRAYLDGDGLAGEEIVARLHVRLVHQMCRWTFGHRGDAEDLAQEAWTLAFGALRSFDQSAPLWPWLRRIGDNAARSRLRKTHPRGQRRDVIADTAELERLLPACEDPTEDHGELDLLVRAIEALPRRDRDVLVLVDIEEVPQRDAAQMFGISYQALRKRLHRSRATLRRSYESLLGLPLWQWAARAAGSKTLAGTTLPTVLAVLPAMVIAGLLLAPPRTATAAADPGTMIMIDAASQQPAPVESRTSAAAVEALVDVPIAAGPEPAVAPTPAADGSGTRGSAVVATPTVQTPVAGLSIYDGSGSELEGGHTFVVPVDELAGAPAPLEASNDDAAATPVREAACQGSSAMPVAECRPAG